MWGVLELYIFDESEFEKTHSLNEKTGEHA